LSLLKATACRHQQPPHHTMDRSGPYSLPACSACVCSISSVAWCAALPPRLSLSVWYRRIELSPTFWLLHCIPVQQDRSPLLHYLMRAPRARAARPGNIIQQLLKIKRNRQHVRS